MRSWRSCIVAACCLAVPLGSRSADLRAQEPVIRVDPRVELLGVLFRMAGRDEYDMTRVERWATAVDAHFEPYLDHPAVRMTERLAGEYRVGFFVPMSLAVHLGTPPGLAERTPLEAAPSLHRTWTVYPDTTREFLRRAREFARDARFDDFLAANAAIVDTAESRARRLVAESVHLEWFDSFWGEPASSDLILVPGLLNGAASYGVEYRAPGDRGERYAITGVTETDVAGYPDFGERYPITIVHEFSHSYADALIDAHREKLASFADSLYAPVADRMRRQAYGSWESMMYETLVRAAVARYLWRYEGDAAARHEIEAQVELGFVWIPGLDELLAEYERSRDAYPALRDFMPRIVAYLRGVAPSLRDRLQEGGGGRDEARDTARAPRRPPSGPGGSTRR